MAKRRRPRPARRSAGGLKAPDSGVTVRMYRPGHGDCFLLALPRKGGGRPVYVLIDCGYKPGSQDFIHKKGIGDIVEHLGKATGRDLDLVVLTHEHQDHLNGLWKQTDPYFGDFRMREAWMAWTEDPDDELADELRKRHRDQLLSLVAARDRLALAAGPGDLAVRRVNQLLALELGGDAEAISAAAMLAAAQTPENSANKQGLKLVRDKASEHRGVTYLSPGGRRRVIPGTDGVRAYVLGPPRDPNLLSDEDPQGSEAFPDSGAHNIAFAGAARGSPGAECAPFNTRFCTTLKEALEAPFLLGRYGRKKEGESDLDREEVRDNAPWRRIEAEWLYSAEHLALKLNTGINNTSLVLAIELPRSGKVLLFAADAQRGNWKSWAKHRWKAGNVTVTVRDLLGRTVLYKVGHHGSHNATLDGTLEDDYANLGWMATGSAAGEFTAMITAVNQWALTKNHPPWRHPLPSIAEALGRKAQGRVFQTDTDQPVKPEGVPQGTWDRFLGRSDFQALHFDYTIPDE